MAEKTTCKIVKQKTTEPTWKNVEAITDYSNRLRVAVDYCELALHASTKKDCYCMLLAAEYWVKYFPERGDLEDLLTDLKKEGVDACGKIIGVTSRPLETIEQRIRAQMRRAGKKTQKPATSKAKGVTTKETKESRKPKSRG